MNFHYLLIFTLILHSFWSLLYIVNTLKWITKPNRVTWGIWAAAPLIWAFATIQSEWFIWSVLPVFTAWFMPLLIFLASFVNKNSYWKLWKLDYLCLIFAIFSLILWMITENPLLAIVFWVLADFLAAIPLLIKVYNFPETETLLPFITSLIVNSTSLLVIKNWVLEEYLFPVYLFFISVLLFFAYFGKKISFIFIGNKKTS